MRNFWPVAVGMAASVALGVAFGIVADMIVPGTGFVVSFISGAGLMFAALRVIDNA